jgi:hypothetical protein
MFPDSAASASSELAPQAQNYSRHNHKYERYKCGVDDRCYYRVGGNELDAKHRSQKRAANGRTYHTEETPLSLSAAIPPITNPTSIMIMNT